MARADWKGAPVRWEEKRERALVETAKVETAMVAEPL